MKIVRLAVLTVSLLLGAGHAVAAGPAHQGNFRLNPALCQVEFNKSPAASDGCTFAGAGFSDGICSFGASCLRPDGSSHLNRESVRLESMHLLRNCSGQLGFRCD